MGLIQNIKSQKKQQYIPNYLNYDQAKQLIIDTSKRLNKHKNDLHINMQLSYQNMKYVQQDWKRSKVTGSVSNYYKKSHIRQEMVQQHITIQLQQIYRINDLLKHLQKDIKQGSMTPTPTPQQNDQDKQCCICFAEKVSTVLPCMHSYCAKCTSIYIIQKQQHKCPQCRRQFTGDKQQIKKQFYEVIEQQKIFYEEARNIILSHLSKRNPQIVQKLKEESLNQKRN